jgi:hypothetical protein
MKKLLIVAGLIVTAGMAWAASTTPEPSSKNHQHAKGSGHHMMHGMMGEQHMKGMQGHGKGSMQGSAGKHHEQGMPCGM